MTTHKIDISHITKFGRTYFITWKHRLTLIFKVEMLWPIVSRVQYLPMAPTTIEIVVGNPTLPYSRARSISMWEDQDLLALTIISNYFGNSIVFYIQSYKISHLASSKLISIFESQDIVTKMHLKDKLLN